MSDVFQKCAPAYPDYDKFDDEQEAYAIGDAYFKATLTNTDGTVVKQQLFSETVFVTIKRSL
ncbi:MAG: hypothetical protein D4S01_11230 [Dehalococcoidia bacterium]|nr:MAG: hypothetical protein D4S01_11230 [Dehalococcoidia bacterium]